MLTIDFARLPLKPGDRALDLGCGAGRHAFEMYRRGAKVTAVDLNPADIAQVKDMFAAMDAAGETGAAGTAIALRGDARRLPFPDGSFDVVVLSEVLEHIPDDRAVIAEAQRVLAPGGMLAVTVPRWWPERICWALSDAYHQVEGGHIRIYRRGQLLSRLRAAGFTPKGTHHAHALHSPYWWLKCLVGPDDEQARLPQLYHKLLVHDIMHRPWWTRIPERLLNPLVGKSFVVYLGKEKVPA
ncbi:class I SAM-dependent methyltransferase [Actinoplanes sp. NPDC048791]|uniref:class I SAM-dependent methyltransferase n=1 Tax=Actinoplanes sp. NPDC048791 TaxID=3154623 RepID=UPI0033FA4428